MNDKVAVVTGGEAFDFRAAMTFKQFIEMRQLVARTPELEAALGDTLQRIDKLIYMEIMGQAEPRTGETCHENTHVFGVGARFCLCGKVESEL